MQLNLAQNATDHEIQTLQSRLKFMGFETVVHHQSGRVVLMVVSGMDDLTDQTAFAVLPFVESISPSHEKFKLSGKHPGQMTSVFTIGRHKIGDGNFVAMAGPCTIESEAQIHAIAKAVAKSGATILRGGAFKPRTSPYDFQGLGEPGLRFMRDAADANNMLCVSELMRPEDLDLLLKYVDIIQIGARNMQNYALLKALGGCRKPVLLKRGLSATYHELLNAAEYILAHGNPQVILCERGIRTFETLSRNTLDIGSVPFLRELTHLPIIVDPSHACGKRSIVPALSYAAAAVQADGIIVEVHTEPDQSVSDAAQAITPATFSAMMKKCAAIHEVMHVS